MFLKLSNFNTKQAELPDMVGCERMVSSPSSSCGEGNQQLGWTEWLRGWCYLVYEILSQKFTAMHLQNPLHLPPLNGFTCIVTGSTSGIGLEMARQLAESGASVVMAVRNQSAAHSLIKNWQNKWSGTGQVLDIEVMELNLLSLQSVVEFANTWNSRSRPLQVLINNAGIFSIGEPLKFSKDGYETHLQVNHLAPALLSVLLLPYLIKGSPSRIVNVNSTMHYVCTVDTNNMNFDLGKGEFTSLKAYSISKLAQVMFCSILHKHLPAEVGISVVCVSPGSVQTNVARDVPRIVKVAYNLIPFLFSPQEGSRSALFAATDPQIPDYCKRLKAEEWPACAYISHDCCPVNASKQAHKLSSAYEVWNKTLDFTGLPSDAIEKCLKGEEIQCLYGAKSG